MDAMGEIRAIFFEECAEGMGELRAALRRMGDGDTDPEVIGTAYRAVHSIKGGAASFQLTELSRFAKTFEALLGEVRSGAIAVDPGLSDLLHHAADALEAQIAASQRCGDLAGAIAALLPAEDAPSFDAGDGAPAFDAADLGFAPVAVDALALFQDGSAHSFDILFRPWPSLYASANEAAHLLRDVLRLGEGHVECLDEALPPLDALDPEGAALGFRIVLSTCEDEAAIRDVFSFVEDDCELTIHRMEQASEAPLPADDDQDLLGRLLAAARA